MISEGIKRTVSRYNSKYYTNIIGCISYRISQNLIQYSQYIKQYWQIFQSLVQTIPI